METGCGDGAMGSLIATVQAVSYALISALGAVMALRILQGRDDCCDHHGPGEHHPHDAHTHAHDHNHDHDHSHHHAHHDAPAVQSNWQMISTGVVAGLRPCTGSILVLLFTLANGMFLIGIGAAFAMALGVAITISLIGLAAIGIRTGTQHLFSVSETSSGIIRRAFGFTGAAIITLFGVMLLLASARQLGWL